MSTYEQIMKSLQAGKFAPLYLLCGEESFYIDRVSDYIENNILDETAKAFDLTVVYGRDLPGLDIAQAVGAARGFAMFGGQKVVIVKEAQAVKKWDSLALYLDNPQPSTILVICYKYGTPDKRTVWWKKADKIGAVMVSERLRDYKVEEWIRTYLNEGRNYSDTWQLDFNWSPIARLDVLATFRYTNSKVTLQEMMAEVIGA